MFNPQIVVSAAETSRIPVLPSFNGDLAKLSYNIKALRQNPQKMDAFIKELNRELKENNANLELVSTKDGRVFVCGNGSTAIEMGKDGNVQLRFVERRFDGSIVVNPGEVVGQDAGQLMKTFGDDAVRGMTRRYDYIKPLRFID